MIAQVTNERQKRRFLNACRGTLCFGAKMPASLEVFGKSQSGWFFAGPTLAVELSGSTAWIAGHANPDELASFLAFCGCSAAVLDDAKGPPPTGWTRVKTHSVFGLRPGQQLPIPAVEEALWDSLTRDEEPPAYPVAEFLFPDRPARRDDFYSELCTKRSRNKAKVWTLNRGRKIVCTVGAYAIANGQAYMACGETVESLRSRGIGGRLIVRMANELSAEGYQPVFLCSPERVHFYTRLGFAKLGEYARYEK